jgi:hypothetical protein
MQVELINDDSTYKDWAMWRKPTHEVTLTYDKDAQEYYSTIRTSPTPWDDFGDPRLLPDAITQKLIKLK